MLALPFCVFNRITEVCNHLRKEYVSFGCFSATTLIPETLEPEISIPHPSGINEYMIPHVITEETASCNFERDPSTFQIKFMRALLCILTRLFRYTCVCNIS